MRIPRNDIFADSDIVLALRSFRHFRSAETEGEFAGPYFGMVGLMNAPQRMCATNSNVGGFPVTDLAAFLEEAVLPCLPHVFRGMIERIEVLSTAGGTSGETVMMQTHLTLESTAELGINTAAPYNREVAEGADEVTFSCYVNHNSRVKKTFNGEGTASMYWARSPQASDPGTFLGVNALGAGYGNRADYAGMYISFGFCLRQNGGVAG